MMVMMLLITFTLQTTTQYSNEFNERKVRVLNHGLVTDNQNTISVWSLRKKAFGVNGNNAFREALQRVIDNSPNADFTLIDLVRVSYFDPEKYDRELRTAIQKFKFWFIPGELSVQDYWSENHMVMFLGSWFLIQQKFPDLTGPYFTEVKKKEYINTLKYYLKSKLKYGFFEYFSGVYTPYTFCGLMNLFDFSRDQEIKENARLLVLKLLKDMATSTNSIGGKISVQSRAYGGDYRSAYSRSSHQGIMYMVLGVPSSLNGKVISKNGYYLATSSLIPTQEIYDTWNFIGTMHLHFGNSILRHMHLLSEQPDIPKEIKQTFLWGSQSFGNPEIIDETIEMMKSLKLENHKFFKVLSPLLNVPSLLRVCFAKIAAPLTGGFSRKGADVVYYRYKQNHLSSLQEFAPGYKTYQQSPYGALVHDLAVFTHSGEKITEQTIGEERSHLPNLKQSNNVLLILYNHATIVSLVDKEEWLTVKLFWPSVLGNEHTIVKGKGIWLFGQRQNSYVALFCWGKFTRNDVLENRERTQMWAIVLGHQDIHNTFSNFTRVISSAKTHFKVVNRNLLLARETKILGSIEVDGENVNLTWEANEDLLFYFFVVGVSLALVVVALLSTGIAENILLILVYSWYKRPVKNE